MRHRIKPPRIVITGSEIFSPYGPGASVFLSGIENKVSALSQMGARHADAPELRAGLINDLSDFRREFPEIRPPLPSPLTQIALHTAKATLRDAGFAIDGQPSSIGAIFNRNRGPAVVVAKSMIPVLKSGPKKMSPLLFSQAVANAPLGAVCVALGLQGPNLLTMGSGALQIAFDQIRSGDHPAILCGGLDEVEGYSLQAALENGFVGQTPDEPASFGEGAAFVTLETLERAQARGARPLAELLAVEQQLDPSAIDHQDLRGWGHVSAQGLRDCIALALENAGVQSHQITDYCGGANGIANLDSCQREAMQSLGLQAVHDAAPKIASYVGDTYGAADSFSLSYLIEKMRTRNSTTPSIALLTHTHFHGQHVAAVLRSNIA